MRTKLVGFAGRARSGKDTAGELYQKHFGGYRYGFADPIREMLKPLGIDMSIRYWQERKEEDIPLLGKSPRYLMQTLGTDWGRNMVCEDIWLKLAEHKLAHTAGTMIITDLRFDNEADWVRCHGGVVVHMTRPGGPAVRAHASEQGIQHHAFDLELSNTGTVDDLEDQIVRLFK